MEIPYSGQLTEKDFASMYRQAAPRRTIFVVILIFLIVCLVYGTVLYPGLRSTSGFLILFLVSIGFFGFLFSSLGAHNAYKQNPDFQHPISGAITDRGITIQTIHASTDLQWGLFQSVLICPDVVLLYQSKVIWNFIFRSQFANETDWQSFITLAKQKVTNQKTRSNSRWPIVSPKWSGVIVFGVLFIMIIFLVIYNFLVNYSR